MNADLVVRKAAAVVMKAHLHAPFRTALGQHNFLENVLFSVTLESGVSGFGEAGVAPHITGETVPQTFCNLKKAALECTGKNISSYERAMRDLNGLFPDNPCARAAFEMAVLDAVSQTRRIPFRKLFGPQWHSLTTGITIVIDELSRAEHTARKFYGLGFRKFKIKIGRQEDEDFKRVLGVSRLVKRSDIYLDANRGYTAEQTLRFLKRLERASIHPALIEQPVPKEDWDGLAKVTRESKVIVAADESASSLSDVRRIIRSRSAHAINIKLMKFGILGAREAVRLARKAGLRLMIGEMMETALGTTAAAHLAGGFGGFEFVDLDAPIFIKEKVTTRSYLKPNGRYELRPVKSGIGIQPISKFLAS